MLLRSPGLLKKARASCLDRPSPNTTFLSFYPATPRLMWRQLFKSLVRNGARACLWAWAPSFYRSFCMHVGWGKNRAVPAIPLSDVPGPGSQVPPSNMYRQTCSPSPRLFTFSSVEVMLELLWENSKQQFSILKHPFYQLRHTRWICLALSPCIPFSLCSAFPWFFLLL